MQRGEGEVVGNNSNLHPSSRTSMASLHLSRERERMRLGALHLVE
jgi:hypothetical protein